jgi:bifunctional non-homologous end joining protein LigD
MPFVLDGEIVCLDDDGRPNFHKLLFRRDWPLFFAFDVLSINGEDLTAAPLLERKRRLRKLMPRIESRLQYVDHVKARGRDLFREVCRRDFEGIVAKCTQAVYSTDGVRTSWIKIKNPTYSQMVGRHELFAQRREWGEHRWRRIDQPVLALD